jgi:hypothetical protein
MNLNEQTINLLSSIDTKLDSIIGLLSSKSSTITKTTTKKDNKEIPGKLKKGTVIKKGDIKVDEYLDCLLVSGDTYARKELIKSLGGKWNTLNNGWTIPPENIDEAKEKLEKYCKSVELKTHNKNLIVETKSDNDEDDGTQYFVGDSD